MQAGHGAQASPGALWSPKAKLGTVGVNSGSSSHTPLCVPCFEKFRT